MKKGGGIDKDTIGRNRIQLQQLEPQPGIPLKKIDELIENHAPVVVLNGNEGLIRVDDKEFDDNFDIDIEEKYNFDDVFDKKKK